MSEVSKRVDVADIFWIDSDNVSRCVSGMNANENLDKTLAISMARKYDTTIGTDIAVRAATAEEVKQGIEQRAELLKLLDGDMSEDKPTKVKVNGEEVTINNSDLLRIANELFVKKGKVVAPKYVGVTGYRRGSMLVLANTIAAKTGQEGVKALPVVVREYSSMMEQIIDNIAENEQKTQGGVRPGLADKIGAAKRLFRLNASEADIGRAFGLNRGATQKFTELCKLDKAYPELNIVGRIVSGDLENAKSYTYSKVHELLKDGATPEEVTAFLANPTVNKPQMAKRKDIERYVTQCPIEILQLMAYAIVKDDFTILGACIDKAEEINKAIGGVVDLRIPEGLTQMIRDSLSK